MRQPPRRRRAASAGVAPSVERSGISAAILYTDSRATCDIKSWLEPTLDTYSDLTLESF